MDQQTTESNNFNMSLSYQNDTLPQKSNPYALMIPSLVTIILNLLSFGVVLTNQKLQSRIKVCFIGHLLTDLGFGFSNLEVSFRILFNIENNSSCYWSVITYVGFLAVTSCMALLQTFDRFLVLKLTYSYVAWITTTKMVIMVVLIYIINFFVFGLSFYIGFQDENEIRCIVLTSGGMVGYILVTVLFSVSVVIVTCLYIYIAKVVRRHERDIQSTSATASTGTDDVGVSGLLRDKKNLITLAMIVFLYTLCYIPMTVTLVQIMLNWETRIQYFDNNLPYHSGILLMANSIINPIIYIWRLKTNREDCHQRLVSCCKTLRRNSVSESTVRQRQQVEPQNRPDLIDTISSSIP